MDLSKGTPQQIADFKNSWKPNAFTVRLHSDLDCKGKSWCKKNLERWEWSMNSWTDIYEHTFLFLYEEDAIEFSEQWPEYTNR